MIVKWKTKMKKLLVILVVLTLTACGRSSEEFEVCNVSIWWEQMPLHYVAQSKVTKEKIAINK